ncbi:hypothetical protein PGRAN_02560 [Listeria grandensis FSL F6-0971]|uniref:Uncharacterized protein n=1 Tax=Listeria grandensis FSL F6-0971 TaxID=1265819 RepID=W7BNW7_9LIST|nr:hypothetical protein [Listeria grandensis]EUJ24741.1 hypothetical protein PGRAN_02560 [Listeria grandensis FSL F6-0971]
MNAKEVRALMLTSVDEIVEETTEACAKLARKGKTSLKVRKYGFEDMLRTNEHQLKILNKLRELGFEAEHIRESGQFWDSYLYVSWKEQENES